MNRCKNHTAIPPHNLNANGDECGACIMREVAWMHDVILVDLLDTIAKLLRQHAQARVTIGQLHEELRMYRPDVKFTAGGDS